MKANTTHQWYAVHTYSGHEKKVKTLLQERIDALKAEDKIIEILVPTRDKVVIADGKKRTVEERLFPGYVLVNMQMTDETWHIVRNTTGVTGFVGVDGKPTPMPASQVESTKKFAEYEAPTEVPFKVGDSVKIIDGHFTDMMGKVDSIDEAKGQLHVLLNIFGRETPVELDFLQVAQL